MSMPKPTAQQSAAAAQLADLPKPRIVIHGGAGNVTRENLPPSSAQYAAYTAFLRHLLLTGYADLFYGARAVDTACYIVQLFEDHPAFNCGRGAVFTRAGTIELEASVMVSRPLSPATGAPEKRRAGASGEKRGVGVALLSHVKNPVLLAKELLLRDGDGDGAEDGDARAARRHNFLSGPEAERLAATWGLDIVDQSWFWTERRWNEHQRGLHAPHPPHAGGGEYLPQGTVGCVVMDRYGHLCVATSTGGTTNKLPGRIGDTPTLGAGFWAEEWPVPAPVPPLPAAASPLVTGLRWLVPECLPAPPPPPPASEKQHQHPRTRAVALSGTGSGDYFLRLAAAHSIAARCRFGGRPLAAAVRDVVGRGGEMQRAAEAAGRWADGSGAGEGGVVAMDDEGAVVWDLNCAGMFRGFIDDAGTTKVLAALSCPAPALPSPAPPDGRWAGWLLTVTLCCRLLCTPTRKCIDRRRYWWAGLR